MIWNLAEDLRRDVIARWRIGVFVFVEVEALMSKSEIKLNGIYWRDVLAHLEQHGVTRFNWITSFRVTFSSWLGLRTKTGVWEGRYNLRVAEVIAHLSYEFQISPDTKVNVSVRR